MRVDVYLEGCCEVTVVSRLAIPRLFVEFVTAYVAMLSATANLGMSKWPDHDLKE